MPRCGIWCLCDWHSLGRDPVGRLDAAATGTGAAMLVQAGRADRGEACNLNGHRFNKASADAGRRGCLRRWPRRSGAGQQSSPSRPTTASAASAAACLQPEADWHQGHVRSTLEMHHVCMAGRKIPKPPITPRRLSRVPTARSSALTVTKAAAKSARTRCTLADEASVRYNRHHAAATQGCMTAMDCNGDIAMRRERAFDRSPCPRV